LSSEALNPLSYVVLALIGRGGAGPHDIVDMTRRGARLYWSASPSKMYAEPKRLERLGLVRSRREPGKTRERTHYELTDAGVAALRAWLAQPSRFPRIYNEAVCRVLAGDLLADDETLLEGLVTLRRELAQLHAHLDEAESIAPSLPHRERYLSLVHSLGRRLVEAHEAWLDEVERDLGHPGRSTSSVTSGRAKKRKGTNVVPSPGET
jgi:PadR family transcriptional regulator, regulatory protein AphA